MHLTQWTIRKIIEVNSFVVLYFRKTSIETHSQTLDLLLSIARRTMQFYKYNGEQGYLPTVHKPCRLRGIERKTIGVYES